ncbi:HAD-IB family phosphatase [candidate division TA06 bacterium]|nr:HAD-IB family phosphatase [candidate division TA06 bacterium]
MMPIVFIDIDGTIVRGTSCEKLFIPYLLGKRKLGLKQYFHFVRFALRHFPKYGFKVYKRDKAYLAGLPTLETGQLALEFIDKILPGRFNRDLLTELERRKAAGDELVLLSGAPEFLAEPLGRKLGIDNVIACRVPSLDGRFTSGDPEQHPYGPSKLSLALEHCRKRGVPIEQTAAYADKFSDLPLLEQVGTAVAVNPDNRLLKTAKRKGWRIIK